MSSTHPRGRGDQRRPEGRMNVPPDYNPIRRHPTGRSAFAACDLHLPDLLRKAHNDHNPTMRWRVSHLETPDPQYLCHCSVPGHWFCLELHTEETR